MVMDMDLVMGDMVMGDIITGKDLQIIFLITSSIEEQLMMAIVYSIARLATSGRRGKK